jgi:AmmeMemoRadiSam system protein A
LITAGDGIELLRIARRSLEERLQMGRDYQPSRLPSNVCAGPQGAFVTLYTHPDRRLRGCIGRIESDWPLNETVARMAVESALHDPRFDPVSPEELSRLVINVSALSTLAQVNDESAIVIGRHGVVVRVRGRTGVFLPEVPVEYGWNTVQMLDRLCTEKMGFPAGAWREEGAVIRVFESERFAEEAPGIPGTGKAGD